jgi:hypothetical protein
VPIYNPPTVKSFVDAAMVTIFNAAATNAIEAVFEGPGQSASSPVSNLTIYNLGVAFASNSTFDSLYGGLSQVDFLNTIAANLTGSPITVAGELQTFLNEFTRINNLVSSGQLNLTPDQIKGVIAAEFTASVLGVTADSSLGLSPSDLAAFQQQQQTAFNRTDVSGAYANATVGNSFLVPAAVGDTAWTASQNILTGVTSDTSTVAAADNEISAAVAAGNTSPIGPINVVTKVVLTPGQDTVTAANVAISGIVDTSPAPNQTTLQLFDNISPAGTNNSLNITTTGTGGPAALGASNVPVLNNVQTVTIQPNVSTSFDPTGIAPALTTIGEIAGVSISSVSFNNINSTTTSNVTLTNMTLGGQTLTVNLTAGSASATGHVTLSNVSGPTPAQAPIVNFIGSDAFSTISLLSSGPAANTLSTLTDTNLAQLNIGGTQLLAIDTPIAFKGAANVQVAATDSGGVSLDLTGNSAVSFKDAGTGLDFIKVDGTELGSTASTLTGSTSGHNILSVTETILNSTTPAQELATINAAANFQTLQMSGASATIDLSKITNAAITDIDFVTNGAVTVTNSTSAVHLSDLNGMALGVVTITGAASGSTLNYDLANGASDGGVDLTNFTNGVLNLTSNGTAANTFGASGITAGGSGHMTINVGGTQDLTLGQFTTGGGGETVNTLPAYTGTLTYTTSGNGDTVTVGGTGALIVTLFTPTLVGGAYAGDQITLNASSKAADQIIIGLASNAGDANAQGFETVTNFVAGQDVYKAAASSTTAAAAFFNDGTVSGANLVTAANTAFADGIAAGQLTKATAHQVVEFTYGGNTYDFIEQSGNNTYTPGQDVIVKEVGLQGTHTTHDFLLS